jgi:hypothetical protein
MAELKERTLHIPMVGEHPTMRRLRELAVAVERYGERVAGAADSSCRAARDRAVRSG